MSGLCLSFYNELGQAAINVVNFGTTDIGDYENRVLEFIEDDKDVRYVVDGTEENTIIHIFARNYSCCHHVKEVYTDIFNKFNHLIKENYQREQLVNATVLSSPLGHLENHYDELYTLFKDTFDKSGDYKMFITTFESKYYQAYFNSIFTIEISDKLGEVDSCRYDFNTGYIRIDGLSPDMIALTGVFIGTLLGMVECTCPNELDHKYEHPKTDEVVYMEKDKLYFMNATDVQGLRYFETSVLHHKCQYIIVKTKDEKDNETAYLYLTDNLNKEGVKEGLDNVLNLQFKNTIVKNDIYVEDIEGNRLNGISYIFTDNKTTEKDVRIFFGKVVETLL